MRVFECSLMFEADTLLPHGFLHSTSSKGFRSSFASTKTWMHGCQAVRAKTHIR
jgi:hypothetical protein